MSGVLKIEIQETAETLKTLLDAQTNVINRCKIQVLWWLKTGVATRVNDLAQMSGYHRTSISRWLSVYRQYGLDTLLEVHPKTGRKARISGEMRAQLAQKLQDPASFSSYQEVQQWLQETFGEEIPYKTVHKTVYYHLQSGIKRPPSKLKK